jgi:TMEM175 potassium channel family protein
MAVRRPFVNFAYLAFAWEVLAQAEVQQSVSARMRQMIRARSFATLAMFVVAMVVSIWFPLWGFALICCMLHSFGVSEGGRCGPQQPPLKAGTIF